MLLPLEFSGEVEELFPEEILDAERTVLGVAVSVHPLDLVEERLQALQVVSSSDLSAHTGKTVTVAGVVAGLRPLRRPGTDEGGVLTLEDREGHVEVSLPQGMYRRLREDVRPAGIVVVRGTVRREAALAEEAQVAAEEVELW
jgi:DNA polymerase III alpha subunit